MEIRYESLDFDGILVSNSAIEALAAYGACCCFTQTEPMHYRTFSAMRHRHAISQRMIEFLVLFQVDEPEMCTINFMRRFA